jgi:nitrite reductase/ring-hydroxylating ferredoxin subunit
VERLCAIDDVQEGVGLVLERPEGGLLLVRTENDVRVYEDRCPHMGLSLRWPPASFLSDDGQFISCANHHALFRIDTGECIAGACRGESLKARAAVIREGAVWLS